MGIDPISPVSPARVKALLLPVGRVKKTAFHDAVARLLPENVVRLGDVSPDNRPGKTTFSPLAYPNGSIIYDLSTTVPPTHHVSLSPFESFRAPFVVLGIADGSHIGITATENSTKDHKDMQNSVESLRRDLYDISSEFHGVVSTQLLLFNVSDTPSPSPGVIYVPARPQSRSTTIKTVMCDVSASFLGGLADFAREVQSWSNIETPGAFNPSVAAGFRSADFTRQESNISLSRPTSPESDMTATRSSQRPVTMASMNQNLSGNISSGSRPSTPAENFSSIMNKFPADAGLTRTSTQDQKLGAPPSGRPQSVSRDSSRDRRSMLSTPAGNSTERAKTKLKARQGVILGTLYLQSGRWNDALRDLIEAASKAQSVSDHVWFAKSLENILAVLLLMASAGSEVQIPRVLLPTPAKAKPTSIPENSKFVEQNGAAPLETLATILPELVHTIVNSYARGANFPGEALPNFPFSESIIRLCYLLAILHRHNGLLDSKAIKNIVTGVQHPNPRHASASDKPALVSKRDVASLLYRAYPPQPISGSNATLDASIIYSGMATVLSHLGLNRKRAMVLQDLLNMLIPSMIQARKVGAAEVGIHPAASLAAAQAISATTRINTSGPLPLENSLHSIMQAVCQIYGIDFAPETNDKAPSTSDEKDEADSNLEDIATRFWKRSVGSEGIKTEILQLCVNLADAIPNFQDVTFFAAALLRTAAPNEVAKMPSPGLATLPRDEQLRLRSKIMRTHDMKLRCDVEYWDDFLLRGLEVFESNPQHRVMSFKKQEIAGYSGSTHDAAATSTGPFLHNPFLKDATEIRAKNVITAGEPTEFLLTLQNPYSFDMFLEKISLVLDGVGFSQKPQGISLGSNKAQRVVVVATAQSEGEVKISGCNIKIQGCKERFFHIFETPWKPHADVKIKAKQIPSSRSSLAGSGPEVPELYTKEMKAALKPSFLELQIIPRQPNLELVSTSLSQSAITLLEGETRIFTVTVRNTSDQIAVDFANLAFEHSPKVLVVQGTRTSADAAAIFEAEYTATHRPPFRWIKGDQKQLTIQPTESTTFTVAVFGRMGLSEGIVQIDYANIGGPLDSVEGKIHTRRLLIPISVTVSASIFLQRVDMIPLRNSEMALLEYNIPRARRNEADGRGNVEGLTGARDMFLMVMDFKNSWSKPLTIQTSIKDQDKSDDTNPGSSSNAGVDTLETDRVTRIVVPCPKLSLSDAHKPIPPPASTRNSQYVFDANKRNDDEVSALQSFWFRQKLLDTVEITWKEPGSKRQGIVDLRGITLTPAMTAAIQRDTVEIRLSLTTTETETAIPCGKDGTYTISSDDFFTMTINMVNNSLEELRPFLSITPRLAHRPRGTPVDLARRIAWTGHLHSPLPKVQPGHSIEQVMGWSIFSPGHYEIEVVVDSQQPRKRASFSASGPSTRLGRTLCSLVSYAPADS